MHPLKQRAGTQETGRDAKDAVLLLDAAPEQGNKQMHPLKQRAGTQGTCRDTQDAVSLFLDAAEKPKCMFWLPLPQGLVEEELHNQGVPGPLGKQASGQAHRLTA